MSVALLASALDESLLRSERPRLVRLCYHFTGSLDAAEDLAQETLYEALRNAHKLHDPSGAASWLSAIARNVCARWNERRGRELVRLRPLDDGQADGGAGPAPAVNVLDDYDLEVELDRQELATLLDRALALLPPETREVLIAHYVHESPHAEIAARLGLTTPTVAKRLERGRLRLKRLLGTQLIHQAAAFGLAGQLVDDWEETPLWCPCCAKRHLLGTRGPDGRLWLICTPCIIPVNLYASLATFRGVRGYPATYFRNFEEHDRRYAGGIAGQQAPCYRCGAPLPTRVIRWGDPAAVHYASGWCARCQDSTEIFAASWHLLATPEGRRFWRDHPRLHFLPDREVEGSGGPALVASVESTTNTERLDGVFTRDTFLRIGVWVTSDG